MSPSNPGKTTPKKAQNRQRGSRCKRSKLLPPSPATNPTPSMSSTDPAQHRAEGSGDDSGHSPAAPSLHCQHCSVWVRAPGLLTAAHSASTAAPCAHSCGHTGTEPGVTAWDAPRAGQGTVRGHSRGLELLGGTWDRLRGEMHCAWGPVLLQGLAHVPARFLLPCLAQPQHPTSPLSGILLGSHGCVSEGALLVKCSTHCYSGLQHMGHPKGDMVLHRSARTLCT